MKNNINQFTIILLALGAFVTGTGEFVVSGILELISFDLDISISTAGQLITIYSNKGLFLNNYMRRSFF